MSNSKPELSKGEPSRSQQVLQWALRHPGALLLGSLALGTVLAYRREINQQPASERRLETEADFIDGDVPLFI